jgi:hypothetical protein
MENNVYNVFEGFYVVILFFVYCMLMDCARICSLLADISQKRREYMILFTRPNTLRTEYEMSPGDVFPRHASPVSSFSQSLILHP